MGPSVLQAPKVAQKEPETYSAEQLDLVLRAAATGWARLAILILLGTGMRVSELCALIVEDIEDDGEAKFLKVRRGKGAKFRWVPVSRHLRRELVRYVNPQRAETAAPNLLVLRDGRPVRVETVIDLFRRTQSRLGFKVHAHRFRHTFATEYLRRGGEIERLRRILGHTSYFMVLPRLRPAVAVLRGSDDGLQSCSRRAQWTGRPLKLRSPAMASPWRAAQTTA